MNSNYGIKSRIPRAPWVLFFDGASRGPAQHAAAGFVLLNSKGQVLQEGGEFLGGGISSELAKYKALIAGLKKAESLKVKHLLVKGNSRLLVNQVVGRCAVEDAYLRDHLKKVWVLSREFDSMLVEFIPKDQNAHADHIANAAIDKELQIQQALREYFNRTGAWPPTPNKTAPASPVPVQAPTPFRNRKLRVVSPPHQDQRLTAGSKPRPKSSPSTRNSAMLTSRTLGIRSGTCSGSCRHEDLDRLSVSDESITTESEEDSHVKQLAAASSPTEAAAGATSVTVAAADDDTNVGRSDDEEQFSKPDHRVQFASDNDKPVFNMSDAVAPSAPDSEIELSEADYDCLVTALINRMKRSCSFAND